ncbi:MAG: hypothetical protein IID30_04785 [Planctomycetes bacterium]|nr:hypothetical protein [Planctomycetota bacterium]
MDEPTTTSQPPPSAPPVTPGAIAPRPSRWPAIIGTIALVFGILATLGGCVGLVMMPVMEAFMEAVPSQQNPALAGLSEWKQWTIPGSMAGMALGVLLVVGGSGLLRRRGWGRRVCLGWAGLKMVLVIYMATIQYQIAIDQAEAMKNDPNFQALPAQFAGFMQSFGMIGVIISVIWGWALPVFLLVWLSRRKIRDDVKTWSEIPPSASQ